MKRFARLIGLVGGVAAVLWAMRDRLISIAAPAEPEPPKFRVVPPPSESSPLPPADKTTEDLTRVIGIGPVFASRLRAAGVDSFAKIAEATDERLAEVVGVTVTRVDGWRSQAAKL